MTFYRVMISDYLLNLLILGVSEKKCLRQAFSWFLNMLKFQPY